MLKNYKCFIQTRVQLHQKRIAEFLMYGRIIINILARFVFWTIFFSRLFSNPPIYILR